MLGCYDFCAHYEWTFAWLERRGGESLLHAYWEDAIHKDSQSHARDLILEKGIEGMKEYWGHTLQEEDADFSTTAVPGVFRIDMPRSPSKCFLIDNGLEQHSDCCDHCLGWIGPLMKEAGFVVHHEHNHCGQCWWEMREAGSGEGPSEPGELAGNRDVRLMPEWDDGTTPIDRFVAANSVRDKESNPDK
ncbi:MAG: hypothetical protein WD342_00385 [Verrucomicrobiales bacterium]